MVNNVSKTFGGRAPPDHLGSLQAMSPIITFRMSHRRREMYIGRLCVSVGPIANLKVSAEFACLSVSDRHFYPSTLADFDETWSQRPYSDLVWPRP